MGAFEKSTMSRQRFFVTINESRVRDHEGELRDQIAALKAQIEARLERRARVGHLLHLIEEREQHLRRVSARANQRRDLMYHRPH